MTYALNYACNITYEIHPFEYKAGPKIRRYMGVSLNGSTPKSSILIGFFHYKPIHIGVPPF